MTDEAASAPQQGRPFSVRPDSGVTRCRRFYNPSLATSATIWDISVLKLIACMELIEASESSALAGNVSLIHRGCCMLFSLASKTPPAIPAFAVMTPATSFHR